MKTVTITARNAQGRKGHVTLKEWKLAHKLIMALTERLDAQLIDSIQSLELNFEDLPATGQPYAIALDLGLELQKDATMVLIMVTSYCRVPATGEYTIAEVVQQVRRDLDAAIVKAVQLREHEFVALQHGLRLLHGRPPAEPS